MTTTRSSMRNAPILVSHVLLIGSRTVRSDLPDLRRVSVWYHTETSVRVTDGSQEQTVRLNQAWCLPDEQTWQDVQQAYAAWRDALRAFADGLRALGTSAEHLHEQGGFGTAPNPLCSLVAIADSPDAVSGWVPADTTTFLPGQYDWDRFRVEHPVRHTPQHVLTVEGGSEPRPIHPVVVCSSPAAWETIWALFCRAQMAVDAWAQVFQSLESYADARVRHAAAPVPVPVVAPACHTDTVQVLPLTSLCPHPDNPRVVLRDDVIDAIVAQIGTWGTFRPDYAVLVRPLAGTNQYQILSGHHRVEAARRAGLTSVPAWVRSMTDAEAYMELVRSNQQGELRPLEIGLHALGTVTLGRGGRGQSGGLRAYARAIGMSRQHLGRLVQAAQVYRAVAPMIQEPERLIPFPRHLAEIARTRPEDWGTLIRSLLEEDWTVEQTIAAVEDALVPTVTDEEIAALKIAVRRRLGTWHGEQRVNGRVTRVCVTFPAQAERAYRPDHLAQVMTAFPEHEEVLPADLQGWTLTEGPDGLVAHHTRSGIQTPSGHSATIVGVIQDWHATLESAMTAGWIVTGGSGCWEAAHPVFGTTRAQDGALLLSHRERLQDQHAESQALALVRDEQWDAAESCILGIRHPQRKDWLMAHDSQALRSARRASIAVPPVDASSDRAPPVDASSDRAPPVDASSDRAPPVDAPSDRGPPVFIERHPDPSGGVRWRAIVTMEIHGRAGCPSDARRDGVAVLRAQVEDARTAIAPGPTWGQVREGRADIPTARLLARWSHDGWPHGRTTVAQP